MPSHYEPQRLTKISEQLENPERALAAAIVLRAVKDYFALRYERITPTPDVNLHELHEFFMSQWFMLLTKIPGDEALSKLEQMFNEGKDVL